MVLDTAILATFVTGGVGIVGILVNKFKCLCHCAGCCQLVSCKWGFLDNAIVDTHEVEFKRITANDNDLIYVSKNAVNVNENDGDNDNEYDADNFNKNIK